MPPYSLAIPLQIPHSVMIFPTFLLTLNDLSDPLRFFHATHVPQITPFQMFDIHYLFSENHILSLACAWYFLQLFQPCQRMLLQYHTDSHAQSLYRSLNYQTYVYHQIHTPLRHVPKHFLPSLANQAYSHQQAQTQVHYPALKYIHAHDVLCTDLIYHVRFHQYAIIHNPHFQIHRVFPVV